MQLLFYALLPWNYDGKTGQAPGVQDITQIMILNPFHDTTHAGNVNQYQFWLGLFLVIQILTV